MNQNIAFSAGKGIDFSGSTDTTAAFTSVTSEVLSDYEEGTWTPIIVGSTTQGTATYTLQEGFYTRIGRNVTATFRLNFSTLASGAGTAQVRGWPFATASINYQMGPVSTYSVPFPSGTNGYFNLNFFSATNVSIRQARDNSSQHINTSA
jgi:hypothetical protein